MLSNKLVQNKIICFILSYKLGKRLFNVIEKENMTTAMKPTKKALQYIRVTVFVRNLLNWIQVYLRKPTIIYLYNRHEFLVNWFYFWNLLKDASLCWVRSTVAVLTNSMQQNPSRLVIGQLLKKFSTLYETQKIFFFFVFTKVRILSQLNPVYSINSSPPSSI